MNRALIKFFVITFFSSWFVWFGALIKENCNIGFISSDLLITLGGFAPSVTGLAITLSIKGKSGVLSLLKSMVNVRFKAKWYLLLFIPLPVVSIVSCFLMYITGIDLPPLQFQLWFIPIAFLYILVLMGPLGEEAGWRGFALPILLKRYSPIKASIILGCIWALWHLPLFFIEGTTQKALLMHGFTLTIMCYCIYTVMISVLITLLFTVSGGSTFSSIVLHTMGNLTLGAVPLIFSRTGAVIYLFCLLIAVGFVVYKYKAIMWVKPNALSKSGIIGGMIDGKK